MGSILAPVLNALPLQSMGPLTSEKLRELFAGAPSASGVVVNQQTALGVSAFYASVRVISESIASLPLFPFERLQPTGRWQAIDHPTYKILHDEPNPLMTSFQFRETMAGHLCIRGNFFAEIEPNGYGQPVHLWPLRPDRMGRPVPSAAGTLIYPYVLPDGTGVELPQRRVLHIRGLSDDGLWGYSPLQLHRETIGQAIAAQEYGSRFFGQGARPGGVLQAKTRLTDEAAARMANSWVSAHQGLENSHRIAVLEEGVEWQAIGMSNDDAQYLESRQFSVAEIARIYRVPPHMIGDVDRSTSWGCFPGDAQVFTTGGPVPIAAVREGDEVWSLGEGELVRARVAAQWMTGLKPIRTIETIGRTLRLTDNHRLPVHRYFGKQTGARRGEAGWRTIWTTAEDVRVGDFLAIPHGLPESDGDTAPNGRPLTVGVMEFCGLYTGDGSRDKNRIEIAHEADPDYMDHYRQIIRQEFGAEPYTGKTLTRTRFSSAEALELLECGFTGNAHTKRVPSWIFGLRNDLIRAYLRGYVDSDGCIQRGRIVYSSCSRQLLEDIRHLCMQVGVPVGRVVLARKAGPAVIRGRVVAQTEKYHLALSSVPFNGQIGSNSPRKAANLHQNATSRTLVYDEGWRGTMGTDRRRNLAPGTNWDMRNLKLQRVRRVTDAGGLHIPVYDISVEGTKTYIADGVLVHNTGIEQMTIGFVTFTLLPWLVRIEQQLHKDLFLEREKVRFYVQHIVAGLLRGDIATRQAFYSAMWDRGVYNADDIREMEDQNPLPDGLGADYRVPLNYQIVGQETPMTAPEMPQVPA